LAVLPLKNYASTDSEYFADGMTEELTNTLTKIEALRVIAHQSVLQFKKSTLPAPEIARMLDVKYLLDASVRQDSARVKITASLVDASRNMPVWTETFDRDRRDVMALQRDVALAIAEAIAITLTEQDQRRLAPAHVPAPGAFDAYIRGTLARYQGNTGGDFRQAIPYLENAIAKDSAWAAPYAGLASAYFSTNDDSRAREFTEKALALDSTLAEGHMVRGMIRQFRDWDWDGSANAFREAIRFNPGFAEAHHELGMLLSRMKRYDDALREARRAADMSPMSVRFVSGIGEVHGFGGHPNEALGIADQLLAMDSTSSNAYSMRGFAYEQLRRWPDATRAWAACIRVKPSGCDWARVHMAYIDGMSGRRAPALQVLKRLEGRVDKRDPCRGPAEGDLAVDLATVYMGLMDKEHALTWLECAANARALFVLYLAVDPTFQPLHAEPRFRALLKRIGLPSS
jgi:serine/threonine-protein kinase